MDPIIDEIYRGFRIRIEIDEMPGDSPRDWDNLGKMVCFHDRYDLGDKHQYKVPRDFLEDLATDFCLIDDTDDLEELEDDQLWEMVTPHIICMPLYLYDHSGITMNTTGFG